MVVEEDDSLHPKTESRDHEGNDDGKFYCGVVEGFYGRPWTTDQRKQLFRRMQLFGMDTYLYAPKDDCKHRMYWRDLYSVEEADHLTGLIDAASEHNINFVYALSPGLDIGYSNSKELACLKRKLEQVSSFGCKSFALLFDDIDVDMNEADKAIYQSFAQAQVAVTNEVYQHLHQPEKFLFCPTEYCSSRAVPSVTQSEYLGTIGSKLLPGVDIMWTGPRVISKALTIDHIKQISEVFHRPPVIWDNIHANDYDQKRLFLGPYEGRPTEIIPHIRGVLTNPNCEFEANYIAIHTLAQWARSSPVTDTGALLGSSPVSSDIKLETEGDLTGDFVSDSYRPKEALHKAVKDWMTEFDRHCSAAAVKSIVVSSPPIAEPSSPIPIPTSAGVACNSSTELGSVGLNLSCMQPKTVVPVNSLVSSSNESDIDSAIEQGEPMDCVNTAASSILTSMKGDDSLKNSSGYDSGLADSDSTEKLGCSSEQMQIDTDICCNPTECLQQDKTLATLLSDFRPCPDISSCTKPGPVVSEDVHLLVDLFYMPFEHGSKSMQLLNELQWLKLNCSCLVDAKAKDATEEHISRCNEWNDRACLFRSQLRVIFDTFDKFQDMPNKAILHDICTYIWDLKIILTIADAFIAWLALGCVPSISVYYLQGNPYTWGSIFYRDAFHSGDQEPWMFRGGLQGEFQRLLPLDGVKDLLVVATPAFDAASKMMAIRPYRQTDQSAVYEICRRTCDDGLDSTHIFPSHPDLVGDRHVGSFLSCSPEYCFVVEDQSCQVVGYGVACLDAIDFYKKVEATWLPAMKEKYSKPEEKTELSPAEELITGFYNYTSYTDEKLLSRFPSMVRVDLLPQGKEDPTAHRRLLATVVATLRTNGSQGIYTELQVGDQNMIDECTKLQFYSVPLTDVPEDRVILGRVI